jgi:selenocysteine lyase/cysteine desulfurase
MLIQPVVDMKTTFPSIGPAWSALEASLKDVLSVYANVHRGAGRHSLFTTQLFEQARHIIRRYLNLEARDQVLFSSPHTAAALVASLTPADYRMVSSQELGLPLGICAVGVRKHALARIKPFQSGGGTVRLVSRDWAIWEGAPERFEAGTPNITGAIALARALQLSHKYGPYAFHITAAPAQTPAEILYRDNLSAFHGAALLSQLRRERMDAQDGFINLDNAASTPTFRPIWEAYRLALRQPAEALPDMVAEVRRICMDFLGAPAGHYELIFTGNTTAAINILAQSIASEEAGEFTPVVVNTLLEHNSNELPWRSMPGVKQVRLSVDEEGFLSLSELDALLCAYNRDRKHGQQRVRLLSISGTSNVTGTCNDLAAVCRIAHRYDVRVLVDAAQLVAHRRIQMLQDGIDYLAFSAHKVYAPFGSGALIVRKEMLSLSPAELNAVQTSGEENAAGITAMGKALVLLKRIGMDVVEAEEHRITARVLAGMASIPGLQVYGVADPTSQRIHQRAGVIAFACDSVPHNRAAHELSELADIGVRTGCFCAHLLVKHLLHIHPLRARLADLFILLLPGFTSNVLPGLVRVSLGLGNNERDVDHLLATLRRISTARRSPLDRFLGWSRNGTPFVADSKRVHDCVNEISGRVFCEC